MGARQNLCIRALDVLRTESDCGDSWSVGRAPIRDGTQRLGAANPPSNFEREMPKNTSAGGKPSGDDKANPRVRKGKAAAILERKPVSGWATSDEDEISLRRWRGRTEVADVVALDQTVGFSAISKSAQRAAAATRWRSEASTAFRTPAAASTTA